VKAAAARTGFFLALSAHVENKTNQLKTVKKSQNSHFALKMVHIAFEETSLIRPFHSFTSSLPHCLFDP
jgi:hypothetical protein